MLPVYNKGLDEKYDAFTASRHIDILTFNRIIAKGFENLTDYQRDVIKTVCERQAVFELDNADLVDSALASYSINGVSMGINDNSWAVHIQSGVVMRQSDYELLKTTGLCSRIL